MSSFVSSLQSADWLMIQGTEKSFFKKDGKKIKNTLTTPKIWGFVQANYKNNLGSVQDTGTNKTPFSLLAPDLNSQSGFNVARGRFAIRGVADDDNKVNYFTMLAFENSGATNLFNKGSDNVENLMDASVTLKYIPYANIRLGQFKTPGSEEGLRATFASPYIEFTSFTNGVLQERQIDRSAQPTSSDMQQGEPATSIGAFRDKGVQIFDTVALSFMQNWNLSYAYMYGNGGGRRSYAPDSQETHYGYLALEQNFGKGKGFFTESVKAYIWGYTGDRKIVATDGIIRNNLQRYGIGMTYYKDGLRVTSELMGAKGMIFTGAKDVDPTSGANDWQVQYAVGSQNKAWSGYLNIQYEVIPNKLEFFGRYDQYNRLTNSTTGERIFKTLTLGSSYRFKGPTRVDFNYSFKKAEETAGNTVVQRVLDNMGDRLGIQVTVLFKTR